MNGLTAIEAILGQIAECFDSEDWEGLAEVAAIPDVREGLAVDELPRAAEILVRVEALRSTLAARAEVTSAAMAGQQQLRRAGRAYLTGSATGSIPPA